MMGKHTSITFLPRLMPAPQAAAYLGISESKLRLLPIRRKELDQKRLYERADLDDYADRLRYEGETGGNTCDSLFGEQPSD